MITKIVTRAFLSSIVVCLVSVSSVSAIAEIPSNGPITPIDYIDAQNGKRSMLSNVSQNASQNSGVVVINAQAASCAPYITTYGVVGTRGEGVEKLQRFLNAYHRAQLPVTGYYGPKTKAAVMAFQGTYNIPATGNQMKRTTDAINALVCQFGNHAIGEPLTLKPVTVHCPVYLAQFNTVGTRNDSVAALQLFLNVHENAQLPITGYYGKLTKAAVSNFQNKFDIAPVTGGQYQKTTALVNKRYCEYGGTELVVTPRALSYEAVVGTAVSGSTVDTQVTLKKPTVVVTEVRDTDMPSIPTISPDAASAINTQSTSVFSDWVALFYALTTLGLLWVIFG